MPALELAGIHVRYGDQEVLRGLDLVVGDGELVVLLGPSGSGKTTALRIVAGLESPGAGVVRIGARDVTLLTPAARNVAMVFQGPSLLPHLTVRANIGFGLAARGVRGGELTDAVERAATIAGCEPLLDRRPDELSGGESQRVALARSLARKVDVLLMDEPLSSLDAPVRTELREEIRRVQRGVGGTMLYVTHDQDEAMLLGDRVAVLVDGAIRQVAPPEEIYAAPLDRTVAAFVGDPPITILPCRRAGDELVAGPFRIRASTAAEVAEIGVRPEDVRVVAGGSSGRAIRVETTGSDRFAVLEAEGARVRARLDLNARLAEGDRVGVDPEPVRAHLFDSGGRRVGTIQEHR